MSRAGILCIAAGLILLAAPWLPFASVQAVTFSLQQFPGYDATLLTGFAAGITVAGLLNQKWLYPLALLCATGVIVNTAGCVREVNQYGGTLSIGYRMMLAGVTLAAIGSVMALLTKRKRVLSGRRERNGVLHYGYK